MDGLSGSNGVASAPSGGFRRSRGVNWTEEETEQLLEAWSDRDVQILLENGPHNRQAFERVSFNLAQRGMDKTPSQCREKIKKLKTIYRNLNGGHGKVSRKIRGRLVQKLHQVMGGVAVPVAQNEKDSSDLLVPQATGQEVEPGVADERQQSLSDDFASSFPASLGPNADFLATGSSSTSDQSSSDAEATEMDTTIASGIKNKSKKSHHRKRSRKSAVYVLIDKIIAAQATSNERFAALEERRLQLDKELEEKRLEADARRQEAQRQHELRLLSTMAQQMANVLKVSIIQGRLITSKVIFFYVSEFESIDIYKCTL